jgi:hypothetical protein
MAVRVGQSCVGGFAGAVSIVAKPQTTPPVPLFEVTSTAPPGNSTEVPAVGEFPYTGLIKRP